MTDDLAPTKSSTLTPIEMGVELFKLRTLKKEVDARIKSIQAELLEKMKELDLEQVKTKTYTLYRTTYPTWRVVNDEAAANSLAEMKVPVYTKVALDMDKMKAVLDGLRKDETPVDGVEYGGRDYVGIREAKDTKKKQV